MKQKSKNKKNRRIYIARIDDIGLLPKRGIRVVFSPRCKKVNDDIICITPKKLFVPFVFWLLLQANEFPTVCTSDPLLRAWANVNRIRTRPYNSKPLPWDNIPQNPDDVVVKIPKKKLIKILNGIIINIPGRAVGEGERYVSPIFSSRRNERSNKS